TSGWRCSASRRVTARKIRSGLWICRTCRSWRTSSSGGSQLTRLASKAMWSLMKLSEPYPDLSSSLSCSRPGQGCPGRLFSGRWRTSGAEPEGLFDPVNKNVGKAGGFEPRPESFGRDYHHRVPQVHEPEAGAQGAVGSGECPSGPEYAERFGDQLILQLWRRDVVQHGERHHS